LGLLPGNLRATNNPRPLDIQIQAPGLEAAEIGAVLNSAASEIWRYCPTTHLDGIDVYYRKDHPQTDFRRNPSGRISIGLTARGAHWSQYSFQFAHEFCHTLANYSSQAQKLVRPPIHSNFWLEESLCETASLFVLRAMSRTWRIAAPDPSWRQYAPWLNAYAQKQMTLPEYQIRAPFPVWFRSHEFALRKNPAIRDWNATIAIHLLPLFEFEPGGWEAVAFLNRGPQTADEPLANFLARWRTTCPARLRPFVTRLAAIFVISL